MPGITPGTFQMKSMGATDVGNPKLNRASSGLGEYFLKPPPCASFPHLEGTAAKHPKHPPFFAKNQKKGGEVKGGGLSSPPLPICSMLPPAHLSSAPDLPPPLLFFLQLQEIQTQTLLPQTGKEPAIIYTDTHPASIHFSRKHSSVGLTL